MEISKETILAIHGKLSNESKLEIEKCFPDYFAREPLNGWFIDDRFPKFMAYWQDGKIYYGIDSLGKWFYHEPDKAYLGAYVHHQINLSIEVVEERLRELALIIGFKTGIVIEGSRLLNDYVEWHTKHEVLTMFGVVILNKGIWVEINPSIPQQKLQQLLEEAEFYRNVDFDTLEKLNAIKNTL